MPFYIAYVPLTFTVKVTVPVTLGMTISVSTITCLTLSFLFSQCDKLAGHLMQQLLW